MKRSSLITLCMAGLLLGLSLACNYLTRGAPTPITFSTPDLTMTAIFNLPSFQSTQTTLPLFISTNTPTQILPTGTNTGTPTEEPSDTPEPKPTKTKVPPVSYVGPDQRSGVSVKAAHISHPPTIDGVFDDWDQDKYDANYVVYGKGNCSDESDLSANFMIEWDEDNLYLAVRVKDNEYVQGAGGENIFKGDSLEILLDSQVSKDFYLAELSSDDYQLGISPGDPNPGTDPENYLWFPHNKEGKHNEVKTGATATDDGYRVEVKIPWSLFGIDPSKGDHFGFVFSVSDNDKNSQNVQQSMVANDKNRSLVNPMTWGDLTLAK